MKKTKLLKLKRQGFTIVELVIVIAVIAILAAVLIPTFSNIVERSHESKALQEAKNAWNEVSYTYTAGYKGFILDSQVVNGWYYDYIDEVAKYNIDESYTVTYDGEEFSITKFDPNKERIWGAITTASKNFNDIDLTHEPYSALAYPTYSLSKAPVSLNISYYSDMYSRGFAWMTDVTNDVSELYIVESNKGEEASFNEKIIGTCTTIVYEGGDSNKKSGFWSPDYNTENASGTAIGDIMYNSHKVHVTGLNPSTTYSYKVGGKGYWKYGVFRTDSFTPNSITAIQVSDAQTLNPGSLCVWENTVAQAIETAGYGLDMIISNGDQFDQRMWSEDNGNTASLIPRIMRYELALDTIENYKGSIPYMTSSGNHEPYAPYSHTLTSDINFAGYDKKGGYYSYDYNFAHFVVLNTNSNNEAQQDWLRNDLGNVNNNSNIKWIIVVMHMGTYATGDHSNGPEIQNLITSLTPIFSQYHVDLVMQAHDHTYNKTLPYRWNSVGYTESYNNTDVVNYSVETIEYNGGTYDLNPNGTYYVTTGAAGHRFGASEAKDGIWADLNDTTGNNISSDGFKANKYKIEVGRITQKNSYSPYTYSNVTSDQIYNIGDYSTGNVNANMFGVLNLTKETLEYDFYTVEGNTVKLFDTLKVIKK